MHSGAFCYGWLACEEEDPATRIFISRLRPPTTQAKASRGRGGGAASPTSECLSDYYPELRLQAAAPRARGRGRGRGRARQAPQMQDADRERAATTSC